MSIAIDQSASGVADRRTVDVLGALKSELQFLLAAGKVGGIALFCKKRNRLKARLASVVV
jgi:hypothetical protein